MGLRQNSKSLDKSFGNLANSLFVVLLLTTGLPGSIDSSIVDPETQANVVPTSLQHQQLKDKIKDFSSNSNETHVATSPERFPSTFYVCLLSDRIDEIFHRRGVTKKWIVTDGKDSQDSYSQMNSITPEKESQASNKATRIPVYCWIPPNLRPYLETSSGKDSEVVNYDALVSVRNDTQVNDTTKGFSGGTVIGESSEAEIVVSLNRTLQIINATHLLNDVLLPNPLMTTYSRTIPANCTMVFFYANWCPFSAKAAPHMNALPRAFPAIQMVAVDAWQHTGANSYFGVISVPTLMLFHNGKIIAKFNDTNFTLHKFVDFVTSHTDQKPCGRPNVTSSDFIGPLSSFPTKRFDYYLLIAWAFIIICFFYYVSKSAIWIRITDFVRTTWREAEAHHEHAE